MYLENTVSNSSYTFFHYNKVSILQLLATMSDCHPWFIRCIKPNSDKCPMKFDMPVVLVTML